MVRTFGRKCGAARRLASGVGRPAGVLHPRVQHGGKACWQGARQARHAAGRPSAWTVGAERKRSSKMPDAA
jgi:hypothetical protein